MKTTTRTLLLEIARCTNVEHCRTNSSHPCARIVGTQKAEQAALQLPEPWCGHIEKAPVLFVSSNPGIAADELFPTWNWKDSEVVDYFANRFGGGRQPWIVDGNCRLNLDGSGDWSSVRLGRSIG